MSSFSKPAASEAKSGKLNEPPPLVAAPRTCPTPNGASNIHAPLKKLFAQGESIVADKPFLTDIKTLRERARQHIEQGAVTEGYKADRTTVIKVLNESLATEIVCVLRYRRHYFMATGIHAEGVAAEFLQHANEEQAHADQIAQRIVQLGGEPNFNPEGLLSRSHAEYVEGDTLLDMIKEDLVAERIAIDSYREIIQYLDNDDPTTRRMMEGILAMEEEHADDLVNLLDGLGK
jgi:bacterioferritin